ncbi:hypothetical protein HDV00_012470 [Rhizophlyctis rosea]|nr:hypothetical protein HDV00_012470 [Rhizophlyctis rosea]
MATVQPYIPYCLPRHFKKIEPKPIPAVLAQNIAVTTYARPPAYTLDAYRIEKQIPLPHSDLTYTAERYGYPHEYIDAIITSDVDQANLAVYNLLYDVNKKPRHRYVGFDLEKRGPNQCATPATIQIATPAGEAVMFHCPTLSADQYPHWLLHFFADPEVLKFGFGITNDVQKLRNIGVRDLAGFVRADEIILWHWRHILGRKHKQDDMSMKDAAEEYLGVAKVGAPQDPLGYEVSRLRDDQIEYGLIDAFLSLEVPLEIHRRSTPEQMREVTRAAA